MWCRDEYRFIDYNIISKFFSTSQRLTRSPVRLFKEISRASRVVVGKSKKYNGACMCFFFHVTREEKAYAKDALILFMAFVK